MANRKLDHTQVRTAYMRGLSVALIAERLECSERQVRRICEGLSESGCPFVGTDLEWIIWRGHQSLGESYRQIGYAYCLSHEHIRQTINEKLNKEAA